MSFLNDKRKRRIFIILTSVVLVLAILVGACAVYLGDYYRADANAIAAFLPEATSWKEEPDGTIVFEPEGATVGLIFYPGGKVECTVYLPLEKLYSYTLLSDENKDFLSLLNREMEKLGSTYGECAGGWYSGTLPCDYNYKNKIRILQNIEYGLLPHVVVRFGQKAEKMGRFIESLPPEYDGLIKKCSGCKKGECDHRIPVTAEGKKYIICNVAWWYFPADVKAIPYIVGAYKI